MISAVIQHLLDQADIVAIVGRRIYPTQRPPTDPLPALVLSTVSRQHVSSLTGDSGAANGALQIDVWAASYQTMTDLVTKVRLALSSLSTTEIQAAWVTNEIELSEPPAAGKAVGTYHTAMDAQVWHGEAV